jgi:hypothetical protein
MGTYVEACNITKREILMSALSSWLTFDLALSHHKEGIWFDRALEERNIL